MISIILTLIQISFGDILYSNSFNSTKGLQSISLSSYCTNLNQENKLRIMLTQQSNQSSLLVICQTNFNDIEKFQTLFTQDNYHEFNCLADYNSYILGNLTQQIVLTHQNLPTQVSQYHNIFSIEKNSCFAIIDSKQNQSLILAIDIFGIDDCAINCKNQGVCINGFCQCPLGFLGFDCDIVSQNIQQVTSFYGFELFYLDLITLQTKDYKLILNSELKYTITCYANFSHLLITSKQDNTIFINEESIIKCKEATERLRVFTKLNYYPQFIIVTNTTSIVKLEEPDESDYSIILPKAIVVSILGIITLFMIITYFLKKYKAIQIINNRPQFENLMPALQFESVSDRISESKIEKICSICLERFQCNSLVRMTYCEHIFHSSCLERWMKKNKICPLCRSGLDTQTIQSKKKIEPPNSQGLNKNGTILQKLSSFQKFECTLISIDGNLSRNSPVIKTLSNIQPKKFELN